jgi:CMP-N-acetylneuraminic acid synthetase
MPKTYSPNGYVDIVLPSLVSSQNKMHGARVFPYLTEQVIEVDTTWDFQMLEMQIQQAPGLEARLFGEE